MFSFFCEDCSGDGLAVPVPAILLTPSRIVAQSRPHSPEHAAAMAAAAGAGGYPAWGPLGLGPATAPMANSLSSSLLPPVASFEAANHRIPNRNLLGV